MISLDNIRQEYRISPKAEQGFVANIAREQAKEYLRKRQPFVWNATNITSQMRESLTSLFETYKARVRIIYLETSWNNLRERNSQREHAVPNDVVESMLGKLVLPEAHEARIVEWKVQLQQILTHSPSSWRFETSGLLFESEAYAIRIASIQLCVTCPKRLFLKKSLNPT